ncbi:hypothetical protein ECH_0889 [Ehrlichia chaffeensis str. Arkansas]|uniref:Uncharacterized protein n=1 Tax=Ehrlichia chaffeensis (strain ATCC CRL-10679 / Arkansas) TaxID=205920 RepID=Q2GFU9_EHRCR|nr:hypothetical protein ECH_0889 [Ehrlichia chaffeensis str. Arkansas]
MSLCCVVTISLAILSPLSSANALLGGLLLLQQAATSDY